MYRPRKGNSGVVFNDKLLNSSLYKILIKVYFLGIRNYNDVYRESILVSGTENVHEVKLHGTPWKDCDGEQNFRLENIIKFKI